MHPVLRLTDARFGYDGTVAAAADLEIYAGEVVAVLGANGSGKSTLVRGALGLVDRYGGDVEWFGRPLGRFRERWRVGYVPQRSLSASPVPATLDEVVRSGRVRRMGLVARAGAADRQAITDAIAAVGLADRRRTPVRELSGGQQRRALVARALAGQAEALVLDEPFAGVDQENQESLAATFRDLAAGGTTLIVVLHELGPLAGAITRTLCLDGGRVVFDGSPTEPSHDDHHHHDPHHHDDHDPHGGETPDRADTARHTLGLLAR